MTDPPFKKNNVDKIENKVSYHLFFKFGISTEVVNFLKYKVFFVKMQVYA